MMGEAVGVYNEDGGDPMDSDSYYVEPFYTNVCIPYERVFIRTMLDSVEFRAVVGFLYSLIWLIGTISNALVLCVVINESRKTRPWVTNRRISSASTCGSAIATSAFFSVRFVFVASLACADLLTSLTSLPVTSINIFTRQWIFPPFICHVIGLFQGFSIFQSSFTFTTIAIDRYLLIFYPNRSLVTKRKAAVGLTITAGLSLLLSAPMGMFVHVLDTPPLAEGVALCGRYCIEMWPEEDSFWDPRVYGTLVLVLQFGLPATVTSWCYWKVAGRLRRLSQRRKSEFVALNSDQIRRQSAASGALSSTTGGANLVNGSAAGTGSAGKRQRTNRMMLAMVVAFVLSWSPYSILNILRDFGWADRLHESQNFSAYYALAHLLGMTTLIWNPVMYAWYNRSIRDALKVIICWTWRQRLNAYNR